MTRSMSLRSLPLALAIIAAAAATPSARATTYSFSALLNGASEVPPVNTPATGFATVVFDDVLSQFSVQESWSGLIGGAATASHIHCCTTTPFSGTAAVFQGFTGFPGSASGTYASSFTLSAGNFATLLAGTQAGRSYVNIHNAAYPNGEISGFLVSSVPEPATSALMLAGLALSAGWTAVRRRQKLG